ncbi:MAG: hypothetical protein HDT42_01795 [Ruminococcaceae bacterium]|nr:hypothetical protein [Oscillospiraceae bacterium]
MKNYEEVTKSVFRKSEEIIARNERRRNTIMTIGMSACCLAAVCGVGTIAWNRARSTVPVESSAQFVSGDYANAPGAGDTVLSENSNVSGDAVVVQHPPLMAPDSDTSTPIHYITTIRGFEVEDAEEKIAPDNGQIHISKALQAAMDKYGAVDENGNEVIYRVVIAYLQNRQTIPATEELWEQECARLKGQTVYGLGFETYSCDWGVHSEHWIHADFTKSKIESFTADPNYGYVIDLYDNYHGYPITDPNDPNHVCFSHEPICSNNSADHENIHHEDDHTSQVTNSNSDNVHHEDDHGTQVTNPNNESVRHEDDHTSQVATSNSGSTHHSNHHG